MAAAKVLPAAMLVLLAAAACAVYGRAVNSPFVFDDAASVVRNTSITRLWPMIGDKQHPGPFSPPNDIASAGRPLVNLSLALNYHFAQLDPRGYHIFNLAVHVLSALLLMAIVRRTLCLDYFAGRFTRASLPLAFAVALLWALHPLQTETVVYVTQRTELMVGFFYLATLYAGLRYWQAASTAARGAWLIVATLACLAGAASKEVIVTAPVVVLLFERTFIRGSFRRAIERSWPLYVCLCLSWALLLGLNYSAPRSDTAGFHLGVSAYDWWLTQTKVLLLYLKLSVWPWPLSIHYQMPYLTTVSAAWPWLAPVALLALATLLLLWRRSAVGFVAAWVLLILSPTLVVPIVTEVAAERRMYLPLAALVALAVIGGYWLALKAAAHLAGADGAKTFRPGPLALVTVASLVLAVVWGSVGARRLAAYEDELTLWQTTLAAQPNDPIAHFNLGNELIRSGRMQEAVVQYEEYIRVNPNLPEAYNNLGGALENLGRMPEAIQQYHQALLLKSDFAEGQYNLANALAKSGDPAEAISHYQQALRINPDYAKARHSLGNVLLDGGRPQEAIEQYQQVLRLNPQNLATYANLTKAYAALQRRPEAIATAEQALEIARSTGQSEVVDQIENWLKTYRAQPAGARHQPTPSPGDSLTP